MAITDIPMRFDSIPLLWKIESIVPDVLCDSLVSEIESSNPSPVATSSAFRDQDRIIRDDPTLAVKLFSLIEPHLPRTIGALTLVGLNERLRLYRYRPGQSFSPHMDHWYQATPTTLSLLTVLVYLNADFEGGQTQFMEQIDAVVVPSKGSVAVFQHKVRHEGREVTRGMKYALRTDAMYKADGPVVLAF